MPVIVGGLWLTRLTRPRDHVVNDTIFNWVPVLIIAPCELDTRRAPVVLLWHEFGAGCGVRGEWYEFIEDMTSRAVRRAVAF